jgi:hypothetical protein
MVSHKVSITLVLFFCINLISTNIYASTVGGWTMSNPVAKGASTVYTGTKNIIINGADYVKKGTAIVTPTASGVAKVLARGAAGYALSVAVEQLIGAVDWVLDPANNQITYTEAAKKTCTSYADCAGYLNLWTSNTGKIYTTPDCIAEIGATGWWGQTKTVFVSPTEVQCQGTTTGGARAYISRVVNPAYDPTAEEQQKTLPLEVVAQKVISNAESGDTNAQVATGAAAADVVAEAETDQTGVKARPIVNQLENTSTTKPAD